MTMRTQGNLAREIEELILLEFSSLCNTCDHLTTCSFPDAGKGVVQCELFENESGISNDDVNLYIQPKHPVYFPEVKGICSNCSRYTDCRLPKDQAGVWHCEEYE